MCFSEGTDWVINCFQRTYFNDTPYIHEISVLMAHKLHREYNDVADTGKNTLNTRYLSGFTGTVR